MTVKTTFREVAFKLWLLEPEPKNDFATFLHNLRKKWPFTKALITPHTTKIVQDEIRERWKASPLPRASLDVYRGRLKRGMPHELAIQQKRLPISPE